MKKLKARRRFWYFSGLNLNSDQMTVSIPRSKINEVVLKIQEILANKKTTTLNKIQSLIGSLNLLKGYNSR
jgi:hypothetical protein